MLPIEQKFISKNYSKGINITPKYIVIHETGNTGKGADADAHYNYWNNNDKAYSSVHFIVDDRKIIQLLPLSAKAWHVGDNTGHSDITNSNAIGVEICVNNDGNYMKARQNAVELICHLIKVTGLSSQRVVTHFDASGKNCPAIMLSKNLWEDFKMQISKTNELTSVNDIIWELHHRGIISNKELWIQKLEQDSDAYWLARKTAEYIRKSGIIDS